MKNYFDKISNYLLYIGMLIGAYGFYVIYISRAGLPEGACPIEDNRPIMFVSIGFLIASLIFSFASDYYKKKYGNTNKSKE
ncbi:hypothetical protein [Clostridium polynesiense]|uniref:hypothetical protein n=1 Tax=Clostridium polynesiense TaxID=1325933 RepID=UPI0006934131|nr:hypothetical protein [Clostridium polynesiense]